MNETFRCDDKAQLVAYLYDELDAAGRRQVDEHLRRCAACASEVAGLSSVRHELAEWTPPEVDLGFVVVPARDASAPVLRPARWWQSSRVPAWAQAAAAVLILSAGLSILNLQVRYGPDGLVVTTGWMGAAPAPAPAAMSAPATLAGAVTEAPWRQELAALERSLRNDLASLRSADAPADVSGPAARSLSSERVAALIEQSERRQRQELALRLAQFGRDLEVQRRSDLVRINQGLGQFEGRAGAEIQRQRQMLDYIMRVSAQPPPQ